MVSFAIFEGGGIVPQEYAKFCADKVNFLGQYDMTGAELAVEIAKMMPRKPKAKRSKPCRSKSPKSGRSA